MNPTLILISTSPLKVDVSVIPSSGNSPHGGKDGGSVVGGWISSLIFPVLLVGGLLFLIRHYNRRGVHEEEDDWMSRGMEGVDMGGGINPMEFGRTRSKVEVNPNTGVTFKEVAGCDQAKFELEEVIDFLRNPIKYTKVSGVCTVRFPVPAAVRYLCRTGDNLKNLQYLLVAVSLMHSVQPP